MPGQVARHGTKPTKRQRGLDATSIPNLKHPVKGGLEGAILVSGEPAEQNSQGLYLIQTNALHQKQAQHQHEVPNSTFSPWQHTVASADSLPTKAFTCMKT